MLDIDNSGQIREFREKTQGDGSLINIGFIVCRPEFIDYIEGDFTVLGKKNRWRTWPGKASSWPISMPDMDTMREKEQLEKLWASGQAPWKVW